MFEPQQGSVNNQDGIVPFSVLPDKSRDTRLGRSLMLGGRPWRLLTDVVQRVSQELRVLMEAHH